MKSERYFYSAAAGLFLVLMLTGFHAFVLRGMGFEDRQIDPGIFVLDAVHGSAIAAWFVLFLAQSLLIATRNRKVHMTLGWSAVVLGPAIAILGTMVAIQSVKLTPRFIFFGFLYSRFLLVMFAEMAMFAVFITAGVLTRKKPKIHRTMMLLTSLTLLPGATARMAALAPIFGTTGWMGLFGPVFCLGAILFAIRWAMARRFDVWFAASYVLLVVAYIGSTYLALTETWDRVAVIFIG